MADDLRERIIRTLAEHGSLSPKGLGLLLPESKADLERELNTMVRRGLAEEPYTGTYSLTDRGRKKYEEMGPRQRPPLGVQGNNMFPAFQGSLSMEHRTNGQTNVFGEDEELEEDEEDEEIDYCEECGGDIEEGECTCDEEDPDDEY